MLVSDDKDCAKDGDGRAEQNQRCEIELPCRDAIQIAGRRFAHRALRESVGRESKDQGRRDEREAERDPADCPFVPFHHCHL